MYACIKVCTHACMHKHIDIFDMQICKLNNFLVLRTVCCTTFQCSGCVLFCFFLFSFFPFYLKGLREFDKVLLNLLADVQLGLQPLGLVLLVPDLALQRTLQQTHRSVRGSRSIVTRESPDKAAPGLVLAGRCAPDLRRGELSELLLQDDPPRLQTVQLLRLLRRAALQLKRARRNRGAHCSIAADVKLLERFKFPKSKAGHVPAPFPS